MKAGLLPTTFSVLLAASLMVVGGGCATEADDASRFREGIPTSDEVALAVPKGASGTTTKSLSPKGGAVTTAHWYGFTRDVADGVDHGTGQILGLVWAIVHLPPTKVEPSRATWGPGSDPLDPITWRFVAIEVAEDEYDYRLEGRPKASTDDADFRAILSGHGYGKAHPNHRMGTFTIDNDAKNAMDPARADDVGTVRIDYALRAFPTTISTAITPVPSSPEKGWFTVNLSRHADGAGVLDVTALGDVEDEKDGIPEDVLVRSRWTREGAGRADVKVANGSLPATIREVVVSECWSTSFARTYYTDSASIEPTSGDASACPYPASSF